MAKGLSRVVAVVAARLNSSRLPEKQLLDLAGEPLIERIFQRLQQVAEIDQLVLATTADQYNQPLLEWAEKSGRAAFAYSGEINDVVGRVDAVVKKYGADIVLFCCGDSPLIEPSTLSKMISALQHNPTAEYVALRPAASGKMAIHEGFYPYRRSVWNRIVSASITPEQREHVGLAIRSSVAELKHCYVDDAAIFSRVQQRISVDTIADYHFMNTLYQRWYADNDPLSIVSLPWVIEQLQADEALAGINHGVQQRAPGQVPLRVLVVTQGGQQVGLGHLARSGVVARCFQEQSAAAVTLFLQGDQVDYPPLDLLPTSRIGWGDSLAEKVGDWLEHHPVDVVIFDLAVIENPADFLALLQKLGDENIVRIAIDGLFQFTAQLEHIHVPSFYLSAAVEHSADSAKISYGWGHYLLPQVTKVTPWQPGQRLLVMSGGSDPHALGKQWPKLLDEQLTESMEIIWIQGPFAQPPEIAADSHHQWQLLKNPADLPSIMENCPYALCVYGVSFFELLQRGVPTVVLGVGVEPQEIVALVDEQVATVATSPIEAVHGLRALLGDDERAEHYHYHAQELIGTKQGAEKLLTRVQQLVGKELK